MISGTILTTSAISDNVSADSINDSSYTISESICSDNLEVLNKINAGTAEYSDYKALNLISTEDMQILII